MVFPEDVALTQEEQAILQTQQQIEEARDEELVRAALARRRRRREKQRQTREFPAHLERRVRVIDLSDEEKVGLKCIGETITERMCFEKPHVYIDRIVRPKYVVAEHPEQGVITQPPPLNIVEGCKYDFGVIAAILAQKYAFHCPTYRQQDWFAQCGWHPSGSTINELINTSVEVLVPLFDQMQHLLLQEAILMTDDTRVQLLTRDALTAEQEEALRARDNSGTPPGKEHDKSGDRGSVSSYACLYRGLAGRAPYNIFLWSLTHQHAVVDAHMAPLRGTLVGDAYSGYTGIKERSQTRIVHASCNAHYPECGFIRRDSAKQRAGSHLERHKWIETPDNCSPQRESRNARSFGDGRQRAAARRSSLAASKTPEAPLVSS